MAKKTKTTQKPREIIFSKEIDDRIVGFAVVFMFVFGGFILQYFPEYLGNAVMTSLVKWTFIIIGIAGMAVEVGKIQGTIRGLDDIIWACLGVGIWILLHIYFNHWFFNIFSLAVLFFGAYELALGLQKIMYSISRIRMQPKEERKQSGDILGLATNLLGIVLVLVQLYKELADSNILQNIP